MTIMNNIPPHQQFLTTTELQIRRASMALNNMGVSLLERGEFTAALKRFRDSLALLKLSADSSGASSTTTPITASQQQADEALRLANTALLNGHHSERWSKSSSSSCASSSCSVVVCPVDDSDVPSMRAALNNAGLSATTTKTTTTVFFPIRLGCTEFETNLDFQAGKVMYNFGLAHLLLYSSSSSFSSCPETARPPPRYRARLLEGALRNLSLSHCLLTRDIDDNNNNNNNGNTTSTTTTNTTIDQFQILCQMLVATLVLQNLYQVFQYQNELPKAQQVLSSLSVLRASVDDSIRFVVVQKCTVSPAA
jgi:hypothetical protein